MSLLLWFALALLPRGARCRTLQHQPPPLATALEALEEAGGPLSLGRWRKHAKTIAPAALQATMDEGDVDEVDLSPLGERSFRLPSAAYGSAARLRGGLDADGNLRSLRAVALTRPVHHSKHRHRRTRHAVPFKKSNTSNSYALAAPAKILAPDENWTIILKRKAASQAEAYKSIQEILERSRQLILYTRKVPKDNFLPDAIRSNSSISLRSPPLEETTTAFLTSASSLEWNFLTFTLGLLMMMDISILESLPETMRTHIGLLIFWSLVAMMLAAEIFFRVGFEGGMQWLVGFVLELLFSVDSIFVKLLIVTALEVPRRLMSKVMFISLMASILFRFVFFTGLGASLLCGSWKFPCFIGASLLFIGVTHVSVSNEEIVDVTETRIVRFAQRLLGTRLGVFYDENDESILILSKDQVCVTLLAVVLAGVLVTDMLLGVDVVFAKMESLPNGYLNFGSSAVGLFLVRAAFFVVKDILERFNLCRNGSAIAVCLISVSHLLAPFVLVTAFASFLGVSSVSLLCVCGAACRYWCRPWCRPLP